MLRRLGEPPIRFELFGEHTIGGGAAPLATVRVRDRGALARLLLDPDFQFGELYVAGRIEVEGDLIGALRLAFSVARPAGLAGRALDALRSRLPHDRGSASHSAHHHYDAGNDFYQLWLDQRMVYTCGYFPSPEDGLEEAQLAKLDHVCRKLALQPGERVIEAGCGLGRPGASHGALLRRARARLQRGGSPAPPGAGARREGRARRPGRVRARRLPEHPRALRRVRLGRHAGARGARVLSRARRRRRARARARRARADPQHRTLAGAAALALDRAAGVPGRVPADAPRDDGDLRAERPRRARRREPAAPLRPHRAPLAARASRPRARASTRWSARSARAPSRSIWRAPSRASRPRRSSSSSWCSRGSETMRFPGRAPTSTPASPRVSAAAARREAPLDRCDVLVVGGGPAGSACAFALRGSGLDVVVADRREFPATRPAPAG